MSHLLTSILDRYKAESAEGRAERVFNTAKQSYESAQKQLTRHQDSACRQVRIKYNRRATDQLDALDEAQAALDDARRASELARQKEEYFGQRVQQADVVAGVAEGRNMGPVIEAEWEEKMALVSA